MQKELENLLPSKSRRATVLVVDDDAAFRRSVGQVLGKEYHLILCESGAEGLAQLAAHTADISAVLLDIKMEGMDGLAVYRQMKQQNSNLPIIFVTGYPGEYEALDIQQELNPFSYIVKGTPAKALRENVERAVAHYQPIHRALMERARLRRERQSVTFEDIVGESSAFRSALNMAREAAQHDIPVLIEGETGTGKELVAQAIHNDSPRRDGPFVALNCGGVAEGLMEDELFGHEPGAGTDMTKQREGCFELADTGTLFLDEIGIASAAFQQRLLRVLQDGRFMRLGGARPIEVDVRIVAATNQNLQQALADGSFRRDLHFRLNAFPVTLPPLRERKEDIAPLSRHFMQWSSGRIGRVVTDISPAALKVLESYNWPGNARELRNVIERAVILCRSETIEIEHLNLHPVVQAEEEFPLNLTLAEIEKRYLLKTFKACEGNVTKTAATLDISANTLRTKLKLYGVKPDAA